MTEALSLTTALMIGLLGGTHCLGMCGGIAATVSLGSGNQHNSILLLGYNVGRISSYAAAGFLLASLTWLIRSPELMLSLRTLAGVILILMGCYLAGWWRVLTYLEKGGQTLWRKIQPLAGKLLPVKTVPQAICLGALWGWLPCGLVYSTLIWASAANTPLDSAILMASFGAGTLPVMLLTGFFAGRLKAIIQHRYTRQISGLLVILFGLFTIPWSGWLS